MMQYQVFDTHETIKDLQNVGIIEKQAETIVNAILRSRHYDISKLATTEQLNAIKISLENKIIDTKAELKEEIAGVRSELKEEIAELRTSIANSKNEILRWMLGFMIPTILTLIGIGITIFTKIN